MVKMTLSPLTGMTTNWFQCHSTLSDDIKWPIKRMANSSWVDGSKQAPTSRAEVVHRYKKPFTSEKQRRAKLRFAKDQEDWTFSDKFNFKRCPTPGHLMVRWRPVEAYKQKCLLRSVKFGGGSVIIWGYFPGKQACGGPLRAHLGLA